MDTVGVSLLVPPVPVPSSKIVPVPLASLMLAPLALDRLTVKASLPSNTVSLVILTVMVWLVWPMAKLTVVALTAV